MGKNKQILVALCALLMQLALTGCSDDSNKEMPEPDVSPAYRSLIHEFIEPEKLFYSRTDFSMEFLYSDDRREITGMRLLSFKVRPTGMFVNHFNDAREFASQLKAVGDTMALALPQDAWDYVPLTRPITKIGIAPKDNDQLPDAMKDQDCSRYFEISYVSYYDYIRNGYSWEGIENPGPVYRMSLEQFNKMPEKYLVDANKITFYVSPTISDNYLDIFDPCCYDNVNYSVIINFADGTHIQKGFRVIDHYTFMSFRNYILEYNRRHRYENQ